MDDQSKPPDSFWRMVVKFLKFCALALALLYVAATVVVVAVLRHPIWHEHLLRFIRRTWLGFVAEQIGSTSPGFINSIIAAVVGLILAAIGIAFLQGLTAMRKHIVETLAMGIVGLATVLLLVYGTQFAWEVAKDGYSDHQGLAATVVALTAQNQKLANTVPPEPKKQKCPAATKASAPVCAPAAQFAQSAPAQVSEIAPIFLMGAEYPQAKNVLEGVSAFIYLHPQMAPGLGPPGKECSVRITAPKENYEVWNVLRNLAYVARCHVDGQRSDDLKPEIEAEALEGAIKDAVIVHAPNDVRYTNASIFLGRFLKVKRKYDMWNEGKPDQEIWIQIGPGIPYKEHNDFATTIK